MKKLTILLLCFTALYSACKKEKDPEPENTTTPAGNDMYHFQLSIGSYWIYESVVLDSNYTVVSTGGIDSVYISGDTIINGKTYFKKESTSNGYTFILPTGIVRDSSGYQVGPDGSFIKHDDFTNILYSYTNTTTPTYTRVARMSDKDSMVTVPAGIFSTINLKEKITFLDSAWAFQRVKYNNAVFAETVGLIFRNSNFAMGNTSIGIRLLRYHMEN